MIRACTAAVAAALVLTACGGDNGGDAPRSGGVDLTGAGATFPYPIYSKWFSDYARETGVRINYQSIGSGGGIRQLSEQTVDFGASDAPMTDEELAKAKGGAVLHIPTVLGGVAVVYNLPGVEQPLNLSGDVLADIFLGNITRWNDPRIAALNPGVNLPGEPILPVYRSDGSGTTFVFTDYLSAVSPAWQAGPGKGKQIRWPVGTGAKGNEGVSAQVKQTPGTIGYTEVAYARQNRLQFAALRNAAGNFVLPTAESISAAATGDLPEDMRASIVNSPAAAAYPISTFTWLLVYRDQTDPEKARKLTEFLRWMLSTGQQSAAALDYAPLPSELVTRLSARIDEIRVGEPQAAAAP